MLKVGNKRAPVQQQSDETELTGVNGAISGVNAGARACGARELTVRAFPPQPPVG